MLNCGQSVRLGTEWFGTIVQRWEGVLNGWEERAFYLVAIQFKRKGKDVKRVMHKHVSGVFEDEITPL
jgi:hypothetical protein